MRTEPSPTILDILTGCAVVVVVCGLPLLSVGQYFMW
jgi:hypothetical protein